jgi:hypothetical protein
MALIASTIDSIASSQRSIEIEAPSRGHAAEFAKMKFCETENVKAWLLHADRVNIADAEFPS